MTNVENGRGDDVDEPSPNIKLPHMPLWVYDIDTDRSCRSMPDAEFGRYMRLLIRQWIEGSVPADAAEAVRDATLDPESVADVQSLLDRKFGEKDGNVRRNPRCAREREGVIAKVEALRENGKKGGRPRKGEEKPEGKPNAKPEAKPNGGATVFGSGSKSGDSTSQGGVGGWRVPQEWKSLVKGGPLPALPGSLDTDSFRAAYGQWLGHLKQKGSKPSAHAVDLQLRKLEEMGHDQAIETIEHCILRNWQGIYEPRGVPASAGGASSGSRAAERRADKTRREAAEAVSTRLL